ncbi:MAG TPA: PIN domain-containing protein [Leptolyngbyaceae cyanobacterium]
MSKFLIIDTCVWIGLAGEPKLYSLLEALNNNIQATDFILILPESVKIEFDRHRTNIKSNWKNKCKGFIGQIKQIIKHFPDHENELLKIHNLVQDTLARCDINIEDNLKLVDSIFLLATVVNNCSDSMLSEAARRVFQRIPPALKPQSSSVGDCLLWLSILEMLKKGEVWFCTDNKHDFSRLNAESLPHEYLDKEAFSTNTKGMFNYFIDPDKFIKKISPSSEELPRYSDYVEHDLHPYFRYALDRDAWMKPITCPSCKAVAAIPYLYSTGYRYVCANCGSASSFFPADDPFL